ncbi:MULTISPECIES: hypothetical protein [Streptomyces]|uniref:hypothetical protein n=1 Tax=Streptomyces TaxID=1883 RepID=UPI00163D16F4|nr:MULTISPECIES: hypothetical protein [Streptomyces]MBC2873948.1 hypothetical protein [Streptomyces sp. TYQ1024]UBI39109.1 hypothetical protein K7I03_23415 [Streptomyces mobaraensis]UKW31689.1 hypothetical protein MCU78_23360 [Streptomyces sp. TYQ1024]
MNRAYRFAIAGALAAGLAAGGAATAFAAPVPAPAAAPVASVATAAPATPATPAAKPALTAQASVATIGAWQEFRVSGKATGIKAGTTVVLQQQQGAKWVSLPAKVAVNKNSAYSMRVKLGIKGKNALRVTGGGAVSEPIYVTVR